MTSLSTSTASIQAIYLASNIACENINTLLKFSLTLRSHCNSGPRSRNFAHCTRLYLFKTFKVKIDLALHFSILFVTGRSI